MKNRIWLFQLPLIALFAFAFWVHEAGVVGDLHNPFLRERLFPSLKRFSSLFLDWKFNSRGPHKPRNNVVVVEIDSKSIDGVGRWPWDREFMAFLTETVFAHGAKVVGYDITFSEPNQKVSQQLREFLEAKKLGEFANDFETDFKLAAVIGKYREKLVLGWMNEGLCQPIYSSPENCQFQEESLQKLVPENFHEFGYAVEGTSKKLKDFDPWKSPFITPIQLIPNIPEFNNLAMHQGTVEIQPDPDGVIRLTNAIRYVGGSLQKPLAFAMAEAGTGKAFKLSLDTDKTLKSLKLGEDGPLLPVTPTGALSVNYRGPRRTFTYVSAVDLMSYEGGEIEAEIDHQIKRVKPDEVLKDAYVLIGLSAVGVYDMRAFPFDSNVPGVEGHATALDNILSGDFLSYGPLGREKASLILFILLIGGGILFAVAIEKLESIPALILGASTLGVLGLFDSKLLFARDIHWNFSFLYAQLLITFVITNAIKYVLEERNKKFIKGAFSKYVAPAIVDSILKDPTKLTVGGERRELSILFSDIRGFTTFSERMDPKQLAAFLNDYLGIMTDVVFDNEGTLDKYIGDAVMAFWGAPLDQAKHAANACKAAKIMLQKLAEHRPRFQSQYGVEVNIGIGINSGLVNVGNMGSDRIFEYTVIGDHVNLASRLEGLTKYYGAGIVTSRFTFDLILKGGEPLPAHRTLDSVKVKGKKDAIELIQVLERDYDAEGLKLFEEARQLYLQQKWDEAIIRFKEASARLEPGEAGDGPSLMYIERCEELKTTGVESDWDGAWKMTSK